MIKKLFLIASCFLMLCVGMTAYSGTANARTAVVSYSYSGEGEVFILVSETADFTKALKDGQTVHGQGDPNHLGYVNIGGLKPNVTYYFAAVAFDKDGHRSPFSKSIAKLIPPYKHFVVTSYPPLPLDGKQVTITIKLK